MPILWAPGIVPFFLQENLHVHKIPGLRGGGILGRFGGGGSADFIFMGAGIFLIISFVTITKIIPPEYFVCNVAATGLSLFAREHAKEFVLCKEVVVFFLQN